MNAHIVFGLFALYVAATSLYMVLSGRQDGVLANLRRLWGRTLGSFSLFCRQGCPPHADMRLLSRLGGAAL